MKNMTSCIEVTHHVVSPLALVDELKVSPPLVPSESGGSVYGVGEKVYLGVRVKMPVRDLLKKIRTDQGLEPHDFQVNGLVCDHIYIFIYTYIFLYLYLFIYINKYKIFIICIYIYNIYLIYRYIYIYRYTFLYLFK